VRTTGKATYYQRYKDKYGRIKQARIGHAASLSLEDARSMARQIRSQALMGVDLNLDQEKLKAMPTLTEFVLDQYLPYVKGYKRTWELYERIFNNKIKPKWGNRKLSEITRQDIEFFKTEFI